MIIVTTNDVPGHRIETTMGECFGLTVRSRNIGSNIGASFKAMAGGELKGITELLIQCRQEALSRLAGEAQSRGANAVVAFRFETTEYAQTGIEVCAYGTAVYATPIGQAPAAPSDAAQWAAAPAQPSMGQQFASQYPAEPGSPAPAPQSWQNDPGTQR